MKVIRNFEIKRLFVHFDNLALVLALQQLRVALTEKVKEVIFGYQSSLVDVDKFECHGMDLSEKIARNLLR
jgi:hypothetical protein